jgi:hypothetical protein
MRSRPQRRDADPHAHDALFTAPASPRATLWQRMAHQEATCDSASCPLCLALIHPIANPEVRKHERSQG